MRPANFLDRVCIVASVAVYPTIVARQPAVCAVCVIFKENIQLGLPRTSCFEGGGERSRRRAPLEARFRKCVATAKFCLLQICSVSTEALCASGLSGTSLW
jgi:hypothetical protein